MFNILSRSSKNRKLSVAALFMAVLIFCLGMTSCKPKHEYSHGLKDEVKEFLTEFDETNDEVGHKQLYTEARNIYVKVTNSQSQYNEDDKKLAEALYNFTNQHEVTYISEEAFAVMGHSISYEQAKENISKYRKELDKLV